MTLKKPLLQSISKNPPYKNNIFINRSNVIVWIITTVTAVLFFFTFYYYIIIVVLSFSLKIL